jgi:tetratricopeptide (TPR) repeat protein
VGDEGTGYIFGPGAEVASRYHVIRRIGRGGMGAVYEVHDQHLDEDVALKLLHPKLSGDDEWRARLRSEVRLARRVSHPNVCRVHDLGVHAGQLFVTMELIRGVTLRSKLRAVSKRNAEPLTLARKVDILVQMCSALSAAHRAGVLHRDVKPDNVILEDDRAVLTDFGVASLTAELAASRRVVAGTPAYIAPEVLRGEPFDERVDVYAAAIIAYELFAGRQPFNTPNLDAAVQRARTRPKIQPLPLQCAPPAVREALDLSLHEAMDFDPARRTANPDKLAEAVARAARGTHASGWVSPIQVTSSEAAPTPRQGAAPEEPTVAAAKDDTIAGAQPHTRATTTARAQVRVATALSFFCEGEAEPEPPRNTDESILETRPIPLAISGDGLERIVVDLGGTPLEVDSHRIVALFGAPVSLGDDAARAARAAHQLIENSIGGHAGIDTARILYRQGDNRVPMASGEAINHSETLAKQAGPGQVRVSPATARQLVGRFRVDEITTPKAHARALLCQPSSEDGSEARHTQVMLGRDDELGELERLVRKVCEEREPGWAAVVAPAGLGKSRLRVELMRRISGRREVTWLVGTATPLGEVAPLSLLRSVDRRWIDTATGHGVHNQPAAFRRARRWLERLAVKRPVVMLLEDVHWADEASLELLDELRHTLADVPVAIITFGRPSPDGYFAGTQAGDINPARVIELGPLADEAAAEIARAIAPAAGDFEIDDLVAKSGGNPFFIEELARDLRERGTRPITQVTPLPATVEAVVQARLDRLPTRARDIACAAAVIGLEFWRDAARAALPEPGSLSDRELDGMLAVLEHRAIVAARPPTEVDDERYVFHSALVRDVCYQQLTPGDRRRAHAAVARWLERRKPGRTAASDPVLLSAIANHKDLAGDIDGARDAYRTAGKRALELFAYRAAATALERARELCDDCDANLLKLLGEALLNAESIAAAEEAFTTALDRTENPLLRAELWHRLGNCAVQGGDNAKAVERFERGLEILAPDSELSALASSNPGITAALYSSLGWILGYVMTDNQHGLEYGERAVALLERTPHRRDLARALSRLGANYMRAGRWTDQLSCNQRNLQIAEELGDLNMQLTAHINLGVVYGSKGDFERSIEHTEKGLALCARTDAITTSALVRSNLAGYLLELRRIDQAEAHLREAIRIAERVGHFRFLYEAYTFQARLRALAGDLAGAQASAERAVELATDDKPTIDEGVARRILAAVLAQRGEFDQAFPLLARSHMCLGKNDPFEDARTWAAEARAYVARDNPGDAEIAERLRESARAVFTRLGANRDLDKLEDPSEIR